MGIVLTNIELLKIFINFTLKKLIDATKLIHFRQFSIVVGSTKPASPTIVLKIIL
ncbi:hypothetical protein BpHYR1_051373 [Brachionus plicatilis]|uniref:Uncharacterized protein n=1 Tax=Brachionus plicatilis TaxID=10195 RepID=A0A3M7QZK9_BRAPC|nr:hypothetical protein BpHYR1_051373 [Brachionus plicatilis]